MNIAIIVLLGLAIILPNCYLKLWWNDYKVTFHFNWFALGALILYLIKTFH